MSRRVREGRSGRGGREKAWQEGQGVRPIFWMRNLGWEECAGGMECIIDSPVFMGDADFSGVLDLGVAECGKIAVVNPY